MPAASTSRTPAPRAAVSVSGPVRRNLPGPLDAAEALWYNRPMGYNTTVFILNDGLGSIEEDPEGFVDQIDRDMTNGSPRWSQPVRVMRTAHADVRRVYTTHANGILDLSPYCDETLDMAVNGPEFQQDYIDKSIEEVEDQLRRLKERIRKARLTAAAGDGKVSV